MTTAYITGRRGRHPWLVPVVRGLALLSLFALCAVPLASADGSDALPIDAGAVAASTAPSITGPDLSEVVDVGDTSAVFSGVCVGLQSPGMAQRDGSGAPIVVDTTPDHDTGAEVGGDAGSGLEAMACVTPCSPAMTSPPYYRPTCTDEWIDYLCGNTCWTAIAAVERVVCSSGCEVNVVA